MTDGGNDGLPDPEDVIADERNDDQGVGDDLPDPEQIIRIHDRIENEYELTHTGAAVAAPRLELERILREVDEYQGTFTRAAALLRKILAAHLFEDANKRTSWAVTVLYLDDQSAEPAERGEQAEKVLKRIRCYSVEEIAEWLANGTIDEGPLRR